MNSWFMPENYTITPVQRQDILKTSNKASLSGK